MGRRAQATHAALTTMPEDQRMYGAVTYWNDRYTKEAEEFEWYQSYDNMKDKIKAAFPDSNGKILNIGSGSSRLPVSMYLDGYKNITSIDFSQACVDMMQGKFADKAELEWKVMDIRDMREFANGTFDYAIDKGTIDSLLCGSNSTQNVYKYLCEVKRVLKPGGTLLVLSYGGPTKRDVHLKRQSLGFSVSVQNIDKPTAAGVTPSPGMEGHHYLYTAKA